MVGLLITLAAVVDLYVLPRLRRPSGEQVAQCDGADWGEGADEGLATPCGVPLTAETVHRVARVTDHAEDGLYGSTASLGTFCEKHCPGSCANPDCFLVAER